MGHRPPVPHSLTALERDKERYATDKISLEEFDKRVGWLIENGMEDSVPPVWYERPPKPQDTGSLFPEVIDHRLTPVKVHIVPSPYDGTITTHYPGDEYGDRD